jgi:fructose-1,6-bisphosphatase/inositol monophosphatase family enzyme
VDDADLDRMMRFAERLADAARAETLPRWRTGCAAVDKNEGGTWDPVTEADREA